MQILWTIAGAILGWIFVELPFGALKLKIPYTFNIGMAFVGGLIAYTLFR